MVTYHSLLKFPYTTYWKLQVFSAHLLPMYREKEKEPSNAFPSRVIHIDQGPARLPWLPRHAGKPHFSEILH